MESHKSTNCILLRGVIYAQKYSKCTHFTKALQLLSFIALLVSTQDKLPQHKLLSKKDWHGDKVKTKFQ